MDYLGVCNTPLPKIHKPFRGTIFPTTNPRGQTPGEEARNKPNTFPPSLAAPSRPYKTSLSPTNLLPPTAVRQRPPRAGQRPPRAGERLPRAGERLPRAGERLPRAGERLPRAGEWLPRAGEWLPRAGEWLPRAGEWLPRAGERLPPAGEWLPRAGEWLPRAGEWLPRAGEWLPRAGEWLPPAGERLPPAGERLPPAGEWLPPAGEWLPRAGERLPPAGNGCRRIVGATLVVALTSGYCGVGGRHKAYPYKWPLGVGTRPTPTIWPMPKFAQRQGADTIPTILTHWLSIVREGIEPSPPHPHPTAESHSA
ncbi:MAG: hypothetical protein OT477_15310 [Chloroflexi bacterium]|nr:hypothetical protein [Chloroflexota bacterium]